MARYETHLEVAQRHVAAGERRLARQQAIVVALAQRDHGTEEAKAHLEEAEALLVAMEDTLQLMREHLRLEQEYETSSSITNLMRRLGWRWWPAAGRQEAQERGQQPG